MKKYPYQNTGLENIKGERWKDIPGFEMYFKVSNYGRIKRLKYELEYSDGRIYIKLEKIIKPVLMEIPNKFMNDTIYFLRATITLHKQKYNFSLARLVYHCFNETFIMDDDSVVILAKDGNGLNGLRVAIFPTINDAARANGIKHTEISRVMQKRRSSAGGFYWQEGHGPMKIDLSGYEYGENLRAKNRQRPVRQYSKQGKALQRFDSIKEAAGVVGVNSSTVIGALTGKHATAGGFKWKYL